MKALNLAKVLKNKQEQNVSETHFFFAFVILPLEAMNQKLGLSHSCQQ